MKNTFDINVLGHKLTISTEKDETYVKELSQYLNDKLKEVKRGNKTITNLDQLILTSLTLSDEILNVRKELEETRGRVEKLSRLLDEKLSHISA